MRRSLNVRLLMCLLGGVAALVVACRTTHAWQTRRHAAVLLVEADRAEEAGRLQQAVTYLSNYLAFVPEDTPTLARYGLTLEKLPSGVGMHAQAMSTLEQVLRREPGRRDIRQAVIRLAFDMGLPAAARSHLVALLPGAPEPAELERLLAWCDEAAGEYQGAVDWLRRAAGHEPAHVATAVRLAELLRERLDKPLEADQVMDALVAANPEAVSTHLARASYRRAHGQREGAGEDLARARALAPDDNAVLLAWSDWASAGSRGLEAETTLLHAVARDPRNTDLHLALARLALDADRPWLALDRLRTGLHHAPGHGDLLFLTAQVLIQVQELGAAASATNQLARLDIAPELLRFLSAQVHLQERQWSAAVGQLNEIRPVLVDKGLITLQTDLALGYGYLRLGEFTRSIAAYRGAVSANPTSAAARAGLARALAEAGHDDEALAECRQAVAQPGTPTFAWITLTRLLINRTLHLPEARRDWGEAEAALAAGARRTPEALEVVLLRAEILAARGAREQAQRLLEQARTRHPDHSAPWCALAALAQKQGRPEAVIQILDDAERRLGTDAALLRARVRFWLGRGGKEAIRALDLLDKRCLALPPAAQRTVLRELAEARQRLGDVAGAERDARRLAGADPHDLSTRLLLVDVYLHRGDAAGVDRVLAELRQLGQEAEAWRRYAEAASLVLAARPDEGESLAQARTLLASVARQHPSWSRVALLTAIADERAGHFDRAADSYLRAVELGERQPRVLSRLASLLIEWRRFAEADQVLRTLEELTGLTGPLVRLAVATACALGNPERAIILAQSVVCADYRDQLWLADVFRQVGRPREAEHVLRAALEHTQRIPDVWIALVGLLAATGQHERAAAVLLEAQAALPERHGPLTLAQCYELLGQLSQATTHYVAAAELRSDDFLVLQHVAGFHLRTGAVAAAQPYLRKLCTPAVQAPLDHAAWARRQLAVGLADSAGEAGFQEALTLLDRNVALVGETLDDLRARARVLAARPDRQAEALRIMTATLPRAPLTASDRLLLAQLHEAAGDVPRARTEMLALLTGERHNPRYVVAYVRCLRRWGEDDEARAWTARLKELDPQAFRALQEEPPAANRANP